MAMSELDILKRRLAQIQNRLSCSKGVKCSTTELTGAVDCYNCLGIDRSTGQVYYKDIAGLWDTILGGGGGGSVALSDITDALAANTIANGKFRQIWAWDTLQGDKAMVFKSATTAAALNTQKLVSIELSGANTLNNQTTTALYVENIHTGTGAVNNAIWAKGNFALDTGVILLNGSAGTAGKVLTSAGSGASPVWSPSVATLTQNQIAFGDGSNLMTSSSSLEFIPATLFQVLLGNAADSGTIVMNDATKSIYIGGANTTTSLSTVMLDLVNNIVALGDGLGNGNKTCVTIDETTTEISYFAANGHKFEGGIILPYIAKTANYLVTRGDYTIHCTANTFTVTLPPAATAGAGKIYNIKNTGAGVITLAADGAELIDGSATQTINNPNSLQVQSTGTGWIII